MNKKMWSMIVIGALVGMGVYTFATKEMRANLLFFGIISIILVLAGFLVVIGVMHFFDDK